MGTKGVVNKYIKEQTNMKIENEENILHICYVLLRFVRWEVGDLVGEMMSVGIVGLVEAEMIDLRFFERYEELDWGRIDLWFVGWIY